MTISQMLGQSGLLTLLGMAVVFAFIIVLTICMNLLHVVLHALKMDKEEVKPVKKVISKPSSVPATNKAVEQKAIIVAICAAVYEKENN